MQYVLRRHLRQRTIRMHFNDKGQLIVSCPYFTSPDKIKAFVENNNDWIEKHLKEKSDLILFAGKKYNLVISESDKNNVKVSDQSIVINTKTPDDTVKNRKLLYMFYKEYLLSIITPLLESKCKEYGLKQPNLCVSNAKTSWGVCHTKDNSIRISAITACLEYDLIEMILVHEITHLTVPDHSKLFWSLLSSRVDNLAEKKSRLRKIAKSGLCRNLF